MLRLVGLVDQWRQIETQLSENWDDARLRLTIADDARCDRAAALLAPLNPGRRGKDIRFFTARRGAGAAPERVRQLLRRLDEERIEGELELLSTGEVTAAPPTARATLVASWDEATAALPPDWSDLYCEVELASTDYLERGAVLMAPLNPSRYGGLPAFRFRCARNFGYGASAGMTRRCLERLDAAGIRGAVRILRVLSDTKPVATQGPVWYVEGRSV
jgi:hypothetical protein